MGELAGCSPSGRTAWLIHTGSISTIWPMFGVANQLLAGVALSVATTALVNAGKKRYAWVTGVPCAFVLVTTITGGLLSIRDNFLPLTRNPATAVQGWANAGMTTVIMLCAAAVIFDAARRCIATLQGKAPRPSKSERFALQHDAPTGCC